jgi:hypothetical protein
MCKLQHSCFSIILDMDISQNYMIIYQTKPTRLVSYLINKVNFNSVFYRYSQVLRVYICSWYNFRCQNSYRLILADEINSGNRNDWKLFKTWYGWCWRNHLQWLYFISFRVMYPDKFIVCYNTKGDISAITLILVKV